MKNTTPKFTEAEIELLKEGLKRTYKERFEMATLLYKVYKGMDKSTVNYMPFINTMWTKNKDILFRPNN